MRILSFGGGVDSSAILIHHLMVADLGIDQVVFADTGAESQATYDNVEFFAELCADAGLPFEVIWKDGETITEWVTRNGTVPVMAGGKHVCSRRFKGEVIAKWVRDSFAAKTKITYLIGIEANEGSRTERFTKPDDDNAEYEYPLQDLGMTRQDCLDLLAEHGVEVAKSSCVFCPFMSPDEIRAIRQDVEAWETIKLVERRFQEASPIKNQEWVDAGRPLQMLRPDGWKKGKGRVSPATKKKGGDQWGEHCKIGYRAPNGMWQHDSWKNGIRLFIKKHPTENRILSVPEWEAVLDSENAA
jgi:3'-phosphoadenosine 5'-phosphosulfate sulfotransferase (PAPS reductase)/FAD synthetase